MVYTLSFFLQNAVCFIILTYLVPVLFTFYTQGVLKLKKNNSGAKRLIKVNNEPATDRRTLQVTAFHWPLLSKDSHFVLPEAGTLLPKPSGEAPLTFVLIKAVYLVGEIHSVLSYKNCMEWATLKYVRTS